MRYKTLTLLVVAFVATAAAQTPKLISVGQIARVDKLTKSFEMKSQAEANQRPDPLSGGITIGTTIGRTPPPTSRDGTLSTDSPGRTFPQPQGRPTIADDPGRQPRGTLREMIFIEEKTVCKDRNNKAILCDDLRVDDRVQVTGDEKSGTRGRGIYATEIVRLR